MEDRCDAIGLIDGFASSLERCASADTPTEERRRVHATSTGARSWRGGLDRLLREDPRRVRRPVVIIGASTPLIATTDVKSHASESQVHRAARGTRGSAQLRKVTVLRIGNTQGRARVRCQADKHFDDVVAAVRRSPPPVGCRGTLWADDPTGDIRVYVRFLIEYCTDGSKAWISGEWLREFPTHRCGAIATARGWVRGMATPRMNDDLSGQSLRSRPGGVQYIAEQLDDQSFAMPRRVTVRAACQAVVLVGRVVSRRCSVAQDLEPTSARDRAELHKGFRWRYVNP